MDTRAEETGHDRTEPAQAGWLAPAGTAVAAVLMALMAPALGMLVAAVGAVVWRRRRPAVGLMAATFVLAVTIGVVLRGGFLPGIG